MHTVLATLYVTCEESRGSPPGTQATTTRDQKDTRAERGQEEKDEVDRAAARGHSPRGGGHGLYFLSALSTHKTQAGCDARHVNRRPPASARPLPVRNHDTSHVRPRLCCQRGRRDWLVSPYPPRLLLYLRPSIHPDTHTHPYGLYDAHSTDAAAWIDARLPRLPL